MNMYLENYIFNQNNSGFTAHFRCDGLHNFKILDFFAQTRRFVLGSEMAVVVIKNISIYF